jgi:carboxypeptidase family protein
MNWKRFCAFVFALLVVLSLGSTRLAAQTSTTGDVAGAVTDPSNAVVPDAKLSLKDNAKGSTQDTKSNKDGAFRFYLLAPGTYTLTVTASGFQSQARQVSVAVGQISTTDVQLALGSGATTVTVTEVAPLLQTENGDTASALSQQQIQNVPNPGNDLSAIAQLAPGAIMNTQGGFGNVEAFGLPATSNLFTMNGMDDNDPFLNLNNSGASNLLLGSNEIQEADVVTNGFSTAYGTFGGINVNYITKSGGNEFHGNAVYYWNGRAMNANDWFNKDQPAGQAQPRPFDNANQWAASIGGPIKKDKLFFFLNTEGLRVLIPLGPSLGTIFVPTAAFENAVVSNLTNLGDTASIPFYCQPTSAFGTCASPGGLPAVNVKDGAGIFNLFNSAKNNPANAVDNLPPGQVVLANGDIGTTGDGCSNFTGLGVIDTGVPAGAAVRSTSGFSTSRSRPAGVGTGSTVTCAESIRETPINFAPEKQIAGRGDWNIGPNDRAYVRMQYDQGQQPSFTDPINPIFNATSNQPEYQGQLNETHIFNPTLTNQFLLAATWYSAIFQEANVPATLAAFPTSLTLGDSTLGGPGACGVGLGCDDFIWPQGRNVTQFQIGDDLSKTIGNHTLKFGAKYHKNYVSDHDFGLFTSGLEVPFSLADFANGGDPAGAGALGGELIQNFPQSLNQPVRLYEVAGYILDEWRVKSNLTITPGLRLEHASDPTCVTLCFSQLGVPFADIGTVQPYNTLIDSNRRQGLLAYQNLQWEPRISFAWQPFAGATGRLKSDFVVRGGIGIFYDIFPGVISDSLAENAPGDVGFTILSANSGAPGATCTGFLAPNQSPGNNLFDCATSANAAFKTGFDSGASSLTTIPNITFTQKRTQAPQYQKWNLEIQKGFGPNDVITIGYNGNHGIHEPVFNSSLNAFGFSTLPGAPATTQFAEVDGEESEGISNYNGVTASYQHRFSGWGGAGVFQLNYTYSKAMDEVSNGGFNGFTGNSILNPENPFNFRQNYGPADYDARHVVNGNYVWELPIRKALRGHGWAPLVDGWQVSGAIFFRTGFPFTITDGAADSELSGNNYFGALFPVPLTAVPSNCSGESHAGFAGTSCFAAGSFPSPGLASPTNPGGETEFAPQGFRNAYRGPKYFDTDFSFVKKTKIPGWERGELQLGLQFFNVFNHPNFTLPISNIANPQFGTIQGDVSPPTSILGSFLGGDAAPRLIQLKAQLVF